MHHIISTWENRAHSIRRLGRVRRGHNLGSAFPLAMPSGALGQDAEVEDEIIVIRVAGRRLLLDSKSKTGCRLGPSVRETSAIVDILSQDLIRERSSHECRRPDATFDATSDELASSPGKMSMRGFTAGSASVL